jgi:hypothetical protein
MVERCGLAAAGVSNWALAFFVLLAWFTPGKSDGLHRFAGYAVIVLIAFRIGWGLFGTRFSRFHAIGRRLRAAHGLSLQSSPRADRALSRPQSGRAPRCWSRCDPACDLHHGLDVDHGALLRRALGGRHPQLLSDVLSFRVVLSTACSDVLLQKKI